MEKKKPQRKPKPLSDDEIRLVAQEIYKSRTENGIHGDALSDWIQAEKQLGVR